MAGRTHLSEEDKMIASLKNIIDLQVADQKVNIQKKEPVKKIVKKVPTIDDLDKLF